MAQVSPFLQMLLNRKRNDPSVYSPDTVNPDLPIEGQGPTIPLRPMVRPTVPQADTATPPELAQQPTIPVRPALSQGIDMNAPEVVPAATIALKPRDVIAEDRQRILDAQAHKSSLGKRILEGLGTYAASGIGLNLKPILHPGGTETEKAQRQLATDLGIQKAQTENQDTQATIALHRAQANKIQNEIDNPDTSDERKAELELLKDGLRSHPGPFDPTNPDDVAFIKRLSAANYPINVATYGKQPKAAGPPETRTRMEGGVKYQTEFDPETKKFVFSTDSDGKRIVIDEAKPETPPEIPEMVPDTTAPWIQKEREHRALAANAKKAAEDAEASLAQWQQANPDKKPDTDVNAARALANAKRFRETEQTENKNANEAYNKRLEAAAGDARKKAEVEAKNRNANRKIVSRPDKDGKHHYTPQRIKAEAERQGVGYDQLLGILQKDKRAVIDQ